MSAVNSTQGLDCRAPGSHAELCAQIIDPLVRGPRAGMTTDTTKPM